MFRTIALLLVSPIALGSFSPLAIGNSISLPGAPGGANLYDEFSANGVRCRQALSTGRTFDTGVVSDDLGDPTVYGRFVFPIGGKKTRVERFDCKKLFELEIRRQEVELQLLERELYLVEDE